MSKKGSKYPVDRPGIKKENPEKYYDFDEEEIGRGKFSVVKVATSKSDGKKYAAKIIYYDDDTIKFAIREFDLMNEQLTKLAEENPNKKFSAKLHETYLVRKYLILIMDLYDGKTLLDYVSSRTTVTEEDVAGYVKQLCETLAAWHAKNLLHLDIRPTNIRFSGLQLVLLDYNSGRHIPNKKAGAVVDVIGDTEFCGPEMLNYDKCFPQSDMWSVAVLTYILLSGISPFYNEDETKVLLNVEKVKWDSDFSMFSDTVTKEAKAFIKRFFKRAPEMRPTAEQALGDPWLSDDPSMVAKRKNSVLKIQDEMMATDKRLMEEEEEEYCWPSLVFRTFEEEEYDSPEEEDEDEEEETK